eukprot:gene3478-6923_t
MEDFSESQGVDNAINNDIAKLNNLWRTEVHSPEILPFQSELVEELRLLVENQEAVIDDKNQNPEEAFTATLYRMEIERVKYSLLRYLRSRICKIEKQLHMIISNESNVLDRLSPEERAFAARLSQLNANFLEEAFINKFPESLKESLLETDDLTRNSRSYMKEFVFCKVIEDIGNVDVGSSQTQRFLANDIHIVQYSVISEYVLSGKLQLI